MDLGQLFKRWLLIAVGVLIASHTSGGIHYESNGALLVAVLLLSFCNVFLKPLLMLFSLPFIVLTFGLGIWFINALLFLLVGSLVSGFTVNGFGSALWGALVVSFTGLIANTLFGDPAQRQGVNIHVQRDGVPPRQSQQAQDPNVQRRPHREIRDDDVIDI